MNNNYSGRWNHVYKLWENVLSQENLPQFDRWLSNEFAKNSKYGSKDRRWYSEVLFSGIRHGYFALVCQESYVSADTNSIGKFAKKYTNTEDVLNALKKIPAEDFFSWVSLRYHFTKPTTDENISLQSIEQSKHKFFTNTIQTFQEASREEHHEQSQFEEHTYGFQLLFHSVPLWLSGYFHHRIQLSNFNDKAVNQFLQNLDSRPPLWIRVNHADKKTEIMNELNKEKYLVEDFKLNCIKVTGAKGVFSLNSYRNGYFEIQDLASQQIGEHVKALPKQYVWDCCAGGGGKTLQIASFLKNKGVVYATDIREYKLEEVKKRAKRAGFFNIRCLAWDGEKPPLFQKEVQIKGGFDWVLVDAPCSSSGTWRRNPDAKYKVNVENIANLTQLQLKILTKASSAVVANGYLVYSTCSWIVDENEKVVEQFLKSNSEFSLVEQNLLGSPFLNADSMFVAVIKRNIQI